MNTIKELYEELENKLEIEVDKDIYEYAKGLVRHKCVSLNYRRLDENYIEIRGEVHGFSITAEPQNYIIIIDTEEKGIIASLCENCGNNGSVMDFSDLCETEVAAILCYTNLLKTQPEKFKEKTAGTKFLDAFENAFREREPIELDYILTIPEYSTDYFTAEFKVGIDRKYVVKDIKSLADSLIYPKTINYGKKLIYSSERYQFNEQDTKVLEWILMYDNPGAVSGGFAYYRDSSVKKICLKDLSLKYFLSMLDDKVITIKEPVNYYEYEEKKVKIIKEDFPLDFKISNNNSKLKLKEMSGIISNIDVLTSNCDVVLYENNICVLSQAQAKIIKLLLNYSYEDEKVKKYIEFEADEKEKFVKKVVPRIENISRKFETGKDLNIIKTDLETEFKLDYYKKKMFLNINFKYGDVVYKYGSEENISKQENRIVVRDFEKEGDIIYNVKNLKFSYDKEKEAFVFYGNDEDYYNFLKEDYKKLEVFGNVYYSDRMKEKKIHSTISINASVRKGKLADYFEFNFEIENVNPEEYAEIIQAVKENRKYYKLKDDSFIELEDKKFKDFMGLVDQVNSKDKSGKYIIQSGKAAVLGGYMKDKNLNFIKGHEDLEKTFKKLTDLKKLKFKLPENLNAQLREYQKTGYSWFKNLDYLGFGGILADEMGLGKTIQTISFLLSEKGKKSLVVTPTSLVYNWADEFNRFAPDLKTAVVHGSLKERLRIIENIKDYDVLITTYGTLKNDIERYSDVKLDYCIIDEAQSIKNPGAQVSKAVKLINAGRKFALTGTPIENNLVELWSIFDFIMPGYLESQADFKRRFISEHDSPVELQKYIKPFILRRLKKDVIKELPEKITKNYYVELDKKQQKVYASYVKEFQKNLKEENDNENRLEVLTYLTKLRELCLEPKLVMNDYKGKNSKLEELVQLIKEYTENNHKILVFSQFTGVLKSISERFDKEKIKFMYLDGSTSASKRLKMVDEFNNKDEKNVFLISLKAGGTGLNLTSADVVIHFDPWWNPAVEEQAADRAHRIGQKNAVNVIKLISKGTIEEKIINLQEEKKKLISDVLDADYTSENAIKSMSIEEMKELFL